MQIREIGIDLPPGFYAQLPKLAAGPFTGLPRVFGAMWSLVAHTDSHLDLAALHSYLVAYQSVEPLTIGELWAVPITLRIVLIENLRRIAELVVDDATARQAADDLSDRVQNAGSNLSQKLATRRSFTRTGLPSEVVSKAATNGVLPGAPRPRLPPERSPPR